jgi:signal transduction histidine kinase/HAMP domain-containing protein
MTYHFPFMTSLRNKLYLLLLTVLVPVLLIQANYSYNRFQARRTNELQANLEVARAVAETFDEFVRSILHQELAIGTNLTMPQPIPELEVTRILRINQAEHPAIRSISWVSPEGRIIASSLDTLVGEDISDRAYVREIIAGREWVLSNLLLPRSTGQPVFSVSRGMRTEEGKLLGIVSMAVVADRLGEMLAVQLSQGGTVTLIDKEGRLVCQYPAREWSWEERELSKQRPVIRDVLGGREIVGVFPCFITGEPRVAAFSPTRVTGWVTGSSRAEQAVMAPIRSELLQHAGLSFLATIMVFLTAMAVSRNITAPVKDLQEHALALGHGNLERRAEVRGSAELRDLASAFNTMAEKVGRREEVLRLDEARFEALYALSQMSDESRQEIEDFVLEQQEKITRSKVGFIAFMNEDENAFTSLIWSKNAMEQCAIPDKSVHFSMERAGLWAQTLRKREPVIINDCSDPALRGKGYPQGHLPLRRLMMVPVFDENRIAVVAGVGNKENEYDYSDVRQLTLLMDGLWKHIRRRRAQKVLRESESLAAIGRAMSAVAHDMKTPLIAIGGFARLVQRHLEKSGPDHESLGIVIEETRRLEIMLKDMLDFSRPLALQRSDGDIHELIAKCIVVADVMAQGKGVNLQNDSVRSAVAVSFDAMRMKQVLLNLLTNAIQASPEGEEVVVRSQLNGDHIFVIDVIDHGCGIPSNDRDEVFSPFFTTKKEGTGLGLPIVKKIIEAHRGNIQILDNHGKGVTFRVQIPVQWN